MRKEQSETLKLKAKVSRVAGYLDNAPQFGPLSLAERRKLVHFVMSKDRITVFLTG